MKAILILSLLVSIVSFGRTMVSLDCTTPTPCKFDRKGLQGCVSKITLSGRPNSDGEFTYYTRPSNIALEVMPRPVKQTVFIRTGVNKIEFASNDGDQWGRLQSSLGGRYDGTVTIDQDFEFQVSCSDKAIGFERF